MEASSALDGLQTISGIMYSVGLRRRISKLMSAVHVVGAPFAGATPSDGRPGGGMRICPVEPGQAMAAIAGHIHREHPWRQRRLRNYASASHCRIWLIQHLDAEHELNQRGKQQFGQPYERRSAKPCLHPVCCKQERMILSAVRQRGAATGNLYLFPAQVN